MASNLVVGGGLAAMGVVSVASNLIERANASIVSDIRAKRHTKKEEHLREVVQKEQMLEQTKTILNDKLSESKEKEDNIRNEEAKIQKYENLRNDERIKMMVVLGHTGDGKSTVLNRLHGDSSEYGDKGPFEASDELDAVTTKVNHKSTKISTYDSILVDTPGYKDTNGQERDVENFNNLAAYLYGCDGVDAFILVMNGSNVRFDGNIQSMLRYFVEYFNNDIWKHLVIVLTRIEGYEKKKFHDKNRSKLYQEKLHHTFDSIGADIIVPIITIGYGEDYNQFRENVMNAVDGISSKYGKLQCQHIQSPIASLKRERDALNKEIERLKERIQEIEEEVESARAAANEQQDKLDNPSATDQYPLLLNRRAEI